MTYPNYPNYHSNYNSNYVVAPQATFVNVRNEMEARSYPIAPGNSVTFKDETAPYIYTKTMGFSQLDRPSFEKYRLVKEDVQEEAPKTEGVDMSIYLLKEEIKPILAQVESLKKEESSLRKRIREDEDDE